MLFFSWVLWEGCCALHKRLPKWLRNQQRRGHDDRQLQDQGDFCCCDLPRASSRRAIDRTGDWASDNRWNLRCEQRQHCLRQLASGILLLSIRFLW